VALEGQGSLPLSGATFRARWADDHHSVDDLFYITRTLMPYGQPFVSPGPAVLEPREPRRGQSQDFQDRPRREPGQGNSRPAPNRRRRTAPRIRGRSIWVRVGEMKPGAQTGERRNSPRRRGRRQPRLRLLASIAMRSLPAAVIRPTRSRHCASAVSVL
jgi:hypothetical protein